MDAPYNDPRVTGAPSVGTPAEVSEPHLTTLYRTQINGPAHPHPKDDLIRLKGLNNGPNAPDSTSVAARLVVIGRQ